MIDEEVRVRMARLRRGDPVVNRIANFNILQVAVLYLASSTGTDFRAMCVYGALAIVCGIEIFKAVRIRRDSASEPEALRRRYGELLSKTVEDLRQLPESFFLVPAAGGLAMGTMVVFSRFEDRAIGISVSLLSVVLAVQFHYQRTRVLPRLERERAEFLGAAAA